MENRTLRVLRIVDGTSVDGPGLRTSIYLAGCLHCCEGCHNPQSWGFDGGVEMTADEIMAHVDEQDFNVTLTGGDPLYQTEALLPLLRRLHAGGRHVWCYTGFTYEQVCADESMRRVLDYIDVLVDGPFILPLRDLSLHFRGSSNQRIIDVKRSAPGNVITIDCCMTAGSAYSRNS